MVEIYDWYKRPEFKPEENSGDEIVEKEGYIPADVQITEMIKAGIRLNDSRKEQYDYADEDVPDDAIPTNSFPDPVDAQQTLEYLLAKGKPVDEVPDKVNPEATDVVK